MRRGLAMYGALALFIICAPVLLGPLLPLFGGGDGLPGTLSFFGLDGLAALATSALTAVVILWIAIEAYGAAARGEYHVKENVKNVAPWAVTVLTLALLVGRFGPGVLLVVPVVLVGLLIALTVWAVIVLPVARRRRSGATAPDDTPQAAPADTVQPEAGAQPPMYSWGIAPCGHWHYNGCAAHWPCDPACYREPEQPAPRPIDPAALAPVPPGSRSLLARIEAQRLAEPASTTAQLARLTAQIVAENQPPTTPSATAHSAVPPPDAVQDGTLPRAARTPPPAP